MIGLSIGFGFLSAVLWFVAGFSLIVPVGYFADSSKALHYNRLSPIFAWFNRSAAFSTGLAVFFQALAQTQA